MKRIKKLKAYRAIKVCPCEGCHVFVNNIKIKQKDFVELDIAQRLMVDAKIDLDRR